MGWELGVLAAGTGTWALPAPLAVPPNPRHLSSSHIHTSWGQAELGPALCGPCVHRASCLKRAKLLLSIHQTRIRLNPSYG